MSCEPNCIICAHPPDYAIDKDPLDAQVFVLKERLMDERHKSYRLECELAEAEQHIEVCSQAAYIAPGQCSYCDNEE